MLNNNNGPYNNKEEALNCRRPLGTGCIPLVEQGQQLPGVVQVVARHPAEPERVQVAKGDRGERHDRGRDLVQFGDVRVLEVEVDPVHAHEQQEGQRAQEEHHPEAALDADALVREDVRDSVQSGAVREHLHGWRWMRVPFFRFYFEIHRRWRQRARSGTPESHKNKLRDTERETDPMLIHLWHELSSSIRTVREREDKHSWTRRGLVAIPHGAQMMRYTSGSLFRR